MYCEFTSLIGQNEEVGKIVVILRVRLNELFKMIWEINKNGTGNGNKTMCLTRIVSSRRH